jgi:C2 domain
VRIYEFLPHINNWRGVAKTETVKNDLNPTFKAKIVVDYSFEQVQKLKFEVIDDDGKGSFDKIGYVDTTFGTIMGSKQ